MTNSDIWTRVSVIKEMTETYYTITTCLADIYQRYIKVLTINNVKKHSSFSNSVFEPSPLLNELCHSLFSSINSDPTKVLTEYLSVLQNILKQTSFHTNLVQNVRRLFRSDKCLQFLFTSVLDEKFHCQECDYIFSNSVADVVHEIQEVTSAMFSKETQTSCTCFRCNDANQTKTFCFRQTGPCLALMTSQLKDSNNELVTQLSSQNGLYTLIYIIELEKTQKSIVNVYQRTDDSWTKFDGHKTAPVRNVECNGKMLTLWLSDTPTPLPSSTLSSKANELLQQTVPSISTVSVQLPKQKPEDVLQALSFHSPLPSSCSSLNIAATNDSSVVTFNSVETPILSTEETITDLLPISNTNIVSSMVVEKPDETAVHAQETYQSSSTITFDDFLPSTNNESFSYDMPTDFKTNIPDEADNIDDSFWDSIGTNNSSTIITNDEVMPNVPYTSSSLNSDTIETSSTSTIRKKPSSASSTVSTISKTDSVGDLFLTLFNQTKEEHQVKYPNASQRVNHDIAVNALASNVLWPLLVKQTKRKLNNSKTTRTSSLSGLSDSQDSFDSNTFSALTYPIQTSPSSSISSQNGESHMNLENLKRFLNSTEPTARTKTSLKTTASKSRRVTPYTTNKDK